MKYLLCLGSYCLISLRIYDTHALSTVSLGYLQGSAGESDCETAVKNLCKAASATTEQQVMVSILCAFLICILVVTTVLIKELIK